MSAGEVTELLIPDIGQGPLVRSERFDNERIALFQQNIDSLPPIDVRKHEDGSLTVLDGVHRISTFKTKGRKTILGFVHEGMNDVEAFAFAAKANLPHGKPLTLAERKTNAEWLIANSKMSNRLIAETCGLDPKTVAALRPSGGENGTPEKREGKDGKIYTVTDKQAANELLAAIRSLMDDGLTDADIQAQLRCSVAPVSGERRRWLADNPPRNETSSGQDPAPGADESGGEAKPDLSAASLPDAAILGGRGDRDGSAEDPATDEASAPSALDTDAATGAADDAATTARLGGSDSSAGTTAGASEEGPDATTEPVASGPSKAQVSAAFAAALTLLTIGAAEAAELLVGDERDDRAQDCERLADWLLVHHDAVMDRGLAVVR